MNSGNNSGMIQNIEKPKMFIYGSSHAKRLADAAGKNKEITDIFEIVAYTKPGSSVTTYPLPPLVATEQDILVIQNFGNSLFNSPVKLEYVNMGWDKIFHLLQYRTQYPQVIKREYEILANSLKNLKCRIYLLDNPIRYSNCCKNHHDPRIVPYQKKQNVILKTFFTENVPKIIVLDHTRMMNTRTHNWLKNSWNYKSIIIDQVHLYKHCYEEIIHNICKEAIKSKTSE